MYPKLLLNFFLGMLVLRQILPCEEHEGYNSCGTKCQRTCQNKDEDIFCIAVCVQGCFCQKGYVRSTEGGPCIPEASCDSILQCGDNEDYSDCATSCPLTCDGSGPDACPEVCLQGCVCKAGFIRSSIYGPCVSNATCSTLN